jgi:hypothetical protein
MNEKVILIDGVKYNLFTPKKEVGKFEPLVIEHIKDIFGKDCKYLPKRKIKTLANNRSIPDGFVIDFKNKKWYILELKLLSDDAINRISKQIVSYKNAVKNLKTKKEIYDAINNPSLYKLIFNTNPEVIIIIDSLGGEKGKQFREQVEGTDRNVKIIEFKTYAREHVEPEKVHAHLFEPLYKRTSEGSKRKIRREFMKEKKEGIQLPVNIFAKYKGHRYEAKFVSFKPRKQVEFEGESYSPSAAAGKITRTSVNGWTFWKYQDENSQEHLIDELRKKY